MGESRNFEFIMCKQVYFQDGLTANYMSKKKVKKEKKSVDIYSVLLYTNSCVEGVQVNAQHNGVWLSLARAPGLGPGGRRFESCHPDL